MLERIKTCGAQPASRRQPMALRRPETSDSKRRRDREQLQRGVLSTGVLSKAVDI